MTQYRNYYIDNITFSCKADIDAFIEKQAVNAYIAAIKMFTEHPDMEHSIYADAKAEYLVNNFGYTWDQVEALEIAALKN